MLYGKIGATFIYNFAMRKFDFRGRWSATPKNKGWSKKSQGRTALKSGAVVGITTFKEAVPPPPPPPPHGHIYLTSCTHLDFSFSPKVPFISNLVFPLCFMDMSVTMHTLGLLCIYTRTVTGLVFLGDLRSQKALFTSSH